MSELRTAQLQASESATRLHALQEGEVQLKDAFSRLSTDALKANQQQFLELADDRFKQAGRPLTESLTKVEQQMRQIEKDRVGAQSSLREQIEAVVKSGETLRTSTAMLSNALRKPQARGQWGELQLRRCVEYAGMLNHCDFVEQASVSTDDGLLRPDMLINLAGGKTVVVDSKVTLVAYLEAHEATDDESHAKHLGRHARHLREHVDALAAKTYWSQFSSSPEFVIMFVPGDGPLNAALEQDPTLLEYAFSKRVQILGPMALVPTLRSISYAWQQQALADNAREVFELGRELYKRIGVFGGHMTDLGKRLTGAVSIYNKAVGSLESQVLVQARRLSELHVVDTVLAEVDALEDTVRPLTKPELLEADQPALAPLSIAEALEPDRVEDYGIDAGRFDADSDWQTGS
jgi:DNA recombination protein RmuC